MHIGIIGAGHIDGNIARPLTLAGHQVTLSLARDRTALTAQASEIDGKIPEPADAAHNERCRRLRSASVATGTWPRKCAQDAFTKALERWPRDGIPPFVRRAEPVFGSAVDSAVPLPSELSGARGTQKDKE
jgi:hypothetical protein